MSDSEHQPTTASPSDDRELLLYDFFKHLTSLSILILGGVLLIAKDFDASDVKPGSIVAAMTLISVAGICSFQGSMEIVRLRHGGKPGLPLRYFRVAAPTLLAMGTGYFLMMFADSLI